MRDNTAAGLVVFLVALVLFAARRWGIRRAWLVATSTRFPLRLAVASVLAGMVLLVLHPKSWAGARVFGTDGAFLGVQPGPQVIASGVVMLAAILSLGRYLARLRR